MNLICACCGGDAPAKHQWWNQDTGYGICPRCWLVVVEKEGEEQATRSYGKYGEHHNMGCLYTDLVAAGVKIANHESDLYFPVTPETRTILAKYPLEKGNATTFTNQVEGGLWFDVPFSYLPWWTRRARKCA